MSTRSGTTTTENPVCATDPDLPPPPAIGELVDPAEPHPDEPGAPDDAPAAQPLRRDI
jgi:hypothetical protein